MRVSCVSPHGRKVAMAGRSPLSRVAKLLLSASLTVGATWAVGASPPSVGYARTLQQGSPCASADSVASRMKEHLEWWLTDTMPSLVSLRVQVGLAGTSPASIGAVTDTLSCSRARSEYYRFATTGVPTTPVAVFRITSNRFAVGDSASLANYGAFALTDSVFAIVAVIHY